MKCYILNHRCTFHIQPCCLWFQKLWQKFKLENFLARVLLLLRDSAAHMARTRRVLRQLHNLENETFKESPWSDLTISSFERVEQLREMEHYSESLNPDLTISMCCSSCNYIFLLHSVAFSYGKWGRHEVDMLCVLYTVLYTTVQREARAWGKTKENCMNCHA